MSLETFVLQAISAANLGDLPKVKAALHGVCDKLIEDKLIEDKQCDRFPVVNKFPVVNNPCITGTGFGQYQVSPPPESREAALRMIVTIEATNVRESFERLAVLRDCSMRSMIGWFSEKSGSTDPADSGTFTEDDANCFPEASHFLKVELKPFLIRNREGDTVARNLAFDELDALEKFSHSTGGHCNRDLRASPGEEYNILNSIGSVHATIDAVEGVDPLASYAASIGVSFSVLKGWSSVPRDNGG